MSILSGITDFIGGGLFKEIKEGVMSYFPPDMTPQQKQEVEFKLELLMQEKTKEANRMLEAAATQLDKRIAEQEGTAKDLAAIGWLGKPILFARGAQRPIWGFATLYMDYQWFFESIREFSDKQESALIVINLLVLGFLFGERAIKNLEPLIIKVFAKG
jgi:hypothetical protein